MLILIRYGEIGLKSRQVRRKFENRLIGNIELKVNSKVIRENDRLFVDLEEDKVAGAVEKLRNTPGVVSVSPCLRTEAGIDPIYDCACKIVEDYKDEVKSFGLKVSRQGQHDFRSGDVANEVGERLRVRFNISVNLGKPDLRIHIEIRNKNAYLYTRKLKGVGGLPVGIEGSVLAVIKDRIGVVAAYLMMRRGCRVIPLTNTSDSEKVLSILGKYDPNIKAVTRNADDKGFGEILKVARTFECEGVVLGVCAEDLGSLKKLKASEPNRIITPCCGMSERECLEFYAKIRA